jgi:hypothetical protein
MPEPAADPIHSRNLEFGVCVGLLKKLREACPVLR